MYWLFMYTLKYILLLTTIVKSKQKFLKSSKKAELGDVPAGRFEDASVKVDAWCEWCN